MDTFAGEHLKPEIIKLNPQHTVPILDDNGSILTDGHAIIKYLVNKYGKAEHATLCPTDPYLRARIDNFQHFDNGTLFNRFGQLVSPILWGPATKYNPEAMKAVLEALEFLEVYLKDDYLVGNNITVADFSCVSTATTILSLIPNESSRFPKLLAWIERMSKLPYYDEVITKHIGTLPNILNAKLE